MGTYFIYQSAVDWTKILYNLNTFICIQWFIRKLRKSQVDISIRTRLQKLIRPYSEMYWSKILFVLWGRSSTAIEVKSNLKISMNFLKNVNIKSLKARQRWISCRRQTTAWGTRENTKFLKIQQNALKGFRFIKCLGHY